MACSHARASNLLNAVGITQRMTCIMYLSTACNKLFHEVDTGHGSLVTSALCLIRAFAVLFISRLQHMLSSRCVVRANTWAVHAICILLYVGHYQVHVWVPIQYSVRSVCIHHGFVHLGAYSCVWCFKLRIPCMHFTFENWDHVCTSSAPHDLASTEIDWTVGTVIALYWPPL